MKLQPWHRRVSAAAAAALLLCAFVVAQDTPKPAPIASRARLLAARSIYIEHAGGRLPNDVIGDAFQGWGHYLLVADPAQADLIVSIVAPTADSGVSVGGGNGRHGAPPPSRSPSSDVTQIRLAILDAHDRVLLWSGSEQPKSSLKESKREDNIVDASLTLFRRFRNLIEPAPKLEPAP